MKARVSQLHNTAAGWAQVQAQYEAVNEAFVPSSGELIVYDPDETYHYARLKIGDGHTALQELSFFTDATIKTMLSKCNIDAGRI